MSSLYSRFIEKFIELYPEIDLNDDQYVYKKCFDNIIILKKCDDTKTNEEREDVFDERYAIFRADKLLVVKILNGWSRDEYNIHYEYDYFNSNKSLEDEYDLTYACSSKKIYSESGKWFSNKNYITVDELFTYEQDKQIYVTNYDERINEIYSNGIHYCKTLEAIFYKLSTENWIFKSDRDAEYFSNYYVKFIHNSEFKLWHKNGQLKYDAHYNKNGKREGKCYTYYMGGRLATEFNYLNGKKEGIQYIYNIYNYEKKNCKCIERYINGYRESILYCN